ncbi:hypothetical protein [Paracidobacterium acidisoli]|uniref:hypothetical protein n=1 Tax=Paracidobacterium acidisoli TaxID=2303751 RepID=UPI000E3C789E|nr:hypothetical protein [Paracidobacterium acidisoli]MBT9329454.1 hypothetical protein [Paracidobacterium acidisoli]
MSQSVEITTPILSAEQVAKRLGVSRKRQKALFRLVDESLTSGRLQSRTGKKRMSAAHPATPGLVHGKTSSESKTPKGAKAAR